MLILGDLNIWIDVPDMKSFCETYNLTNLIKQSTCYKNADNPTCIDLILTNVPSTFQSTCVTETGLLDFHLMILTKQRTLKRNNEKFENEKQPSTKENRRNSQALCKTKE